MAVPNDSATTLEKEWGDQHATKFPEWVRALLKEKSHRPAEEQDYILSVLHNNFIRCHYQLSTAIIRL